MLLFQNYPRARQKDPRNRYVGHCLLATEVDANVYLGCGTRPCGFNLQR